MRNNFTVLIFFTLLSLIGLALMPLLEVRLLPGRSAPAITVVYNFSGGSGEVLDAAVTTPLEGAFSTLSGVQEMTSRTSKGAGSITLSFDKKTDMDAMRFEVATILRQMMPHFPPGMHPPQIYTRNPNEEQDAQNLLTFAVNGPGDKNQIRQTLEKEIIPTLVDIKGIHDAVVSGADRLQWQLQYNDKAMQEANITESDIRQAFQNQYYSRNLGMAQTTTEGIKYPVVYSGLPNDSICWDKIIIQKHGRSFVLTDLVKVSQQKEEPRSYYRINGLNTVYLYITSGKDANQLVAGREVKEKLNQLKQQMPAGYSFVTSYDTTEFIKDELTKISFRIGLSLLLLLLFVFVVSRSGKYVLITCLSLLANLCIAFIFYYVFGVEIHIYSMAGITISLGIMIDNTIVMTDHLKHHDNRNVFMAILASTLTTVGAMVVILFLDEQQKLRLLDFAYVIAINLMVSLAVALFLIPALTQKMSLHQSTKKVKIRQVKRIVRFTQRYEKVIYFGKRWKKTAFVCAVLLFGLPLFKLPNSVENKEWPGKMYNATIGNSWYQTNLRSPIEIVLGGFLRPFATKVSHSGSDESSKRTMLTLRGSMPQGATMPQINNIFLKLENFLSQYEGIEQFTTNIRSPQNGSMTISFTPEAEFSSLPFQVKEEVQSYCVDIGPSDWQIMGVGRGFDNSLREGQRNSRMVLYGYNLEQLKRFAYSLRDELEKVPRVEQVFVNGKANYLDRVAYEYTLNLNNKLLANNKVSRGVMLNAVQTQVQKESQVHSLYTDDGNYMPVMFTKDNSNNSVWEFYNSSVSLNEHKHVKVKDAGTISKTRVADLINKVDMQYKLVVEFDFIGSYGQKSYILGELTDDFITRLPIGYRLERERYTGSSWGAEDKDNKRTSLILLILLIIYFICAILLESLLQPLAVIGMIPLSFIGVFIVFWAFKLPFGDGGYASMLLLAGLTVNSALYILNDYNNLLKENNKLSLVTLYLKAYHHKIIPILLTIFSTVLGLIPFLFGGRQDPFWFSLAVGTMGGLVFSLFGLLMYLPLYLRMKRAMRVASHKGE